MSFSPKTLALIAAMREVALAGNAGFKLIALVEDRGLEIPPEETALAGSLVAEHPGAVLICGSELALLPLEQGFGDLSIVAYNIQTHCISYCNDQKCSPKFFGLLGLIAARQAIEGSVLDSTPEDMAVSQIMRELDSIRFGLNLLRQILDIDEAAVRPNNKTRSELLLDRLQLWAPVQSKFEQDVREALVIELAALVEATAFASRMPAGRTRRHPPRPKVHRTH